MDSGSVGGNGSEWKEGEVAGRRAEAVAKEDQK